jgi:glycine betaine/choline ABC-type transport system substrate-binding protein
MMFLWRPVMSEPPLAKWLDMLGHDLTLDDVADMNEALDLKEEMMQRVIAKQRGA